MQLAGKILYRIARHWIAGTRLADAIMIAKELNKRGIKVLINYLGENVVRREGAENILAEYSRLLKAIGSLHLNADITIKLTQFCLHPDSKYCHSSLAKLLQLAKKRKIFVWFDMEDSKHVETTIELYLALLKNYPGIGITVQAYLKRSRRDMAKILSHKGVVRLVKGAYRGDYAWREDIDRNYLKLMRILFSKAQRFSIATHDERLIAAVQKLNTRYKRNVEYDVLYGIKDDLTAKLAAGGNNVAVYLPYGNEWKAYALRRIRERKRNILLLLHL